jgi:hypothetical protein
MFDTAAMQGDFEEPIADSIPAPKIAKRNPSQLVQVQTPAQPSFAWATPKNLILGGVGLVSIAIAIAAVSTSQPKPAEQILPYVPKTLADVAPQILAENKEKQAQSLADLNALAEEGLRQDDKAAIRILAVKYAIDANKAVQSGDKQCLRSPIGLDCHLNFQEDAWSARRKAASLSKNAEQMVVATTHLRAIEMARSGKVELVETDPELTELALRNRYNARVDLLNSSANEKARQLNKKL